MIQNAPCPCERCGPPPQRLGQIVAGAALLGAFPLAHVLTPLLLRDAVPLCPFRIATGKPCPFCGLTRAIGLATHGRWRSAFTMNPLWPLFAAMMIALGILLIVDAWTRRDRGRRVVRAVSARWVWILLALIIFDIWRIA